MKKLNSILMALLFVVLMGSMGKAQYANFWYFGDHAGVDFTIPTSPTAISGSLYTNEGCASMCDNTGTLLFYTDGTSIWDNTHTVINPSTPLYGNSSSTQSAIIVPKPGSSTRYYIFTQDEHGLGTCSYGLNWSEVDVTSYVVTLISANTNLLGCGSTTEKVTAACHANGSDYWVVTVLQNGDFYSYPVTSSGVGSPVVSSGMATPCATSGGPFRDDRVGYMKVSPQGNHIVLARRMYNSVNEAFDFNNSTGAVTSNLGTYYTGTAYGVEFSSNGNYFYVSQGFGQVYQYDWSYTSTLLYTTNGPSLGALQMGPDGNIWVANGYENTDGYYLDMISNVNTWGATYNDDYLAMASGTHSRLGLPDIISCFVPNPSCQLNADFKAVWNPQTCSVDFIDMSTAGSGTTIVAWDWTFGDGYSSNLQNPSHHYATAGGYVVCLTITGWDGQKCCTSRICMDVQAGQCDIDCKVDAQFNWMADRCNPCTIDFSGFLGYANRDVIAWMWDFGDGNTGSGQNTSHTYAASGVYNVCLILFVRSGPNSDECCVFKFCRPIQVDCNGTPPNNPPSKQAAPKGNTQSQVNEQGLTVFPNPTRGQLQLEFEVPNSQRVKMQMIDMLGKAQWQNTENNVPKGHTTKKIDVSTLPAGIYLLVIDGENFKYTEKIQVVKDY